MKQIGRNVRFKKVITLVFSNFDPLAEWISYTRVWVNTYGASAVQGERQ
jgi:hypothetical protein